MDYTVYYVPGNHEAKSDRYRQILRQATAAGAIVLRNDYAFYNASLAVLGVEDLTSFAAGSGAVAAEIDRLVRESRAAQARILLSHRPNLVDVYAASGVDVVLSGHAHGGQIRVPGFGGLFVRDQGWFPKYTEGVHRLTRPKGETTHLVISRGLGGPWLIPRLFNPPEIVVVGINSQKQVA